MVPALASVSMMVGAPARSRTNPAEIEIVPATDVRREHDALRGEIDRPAEPDPAPFEGEVATPGGHDLGDLSQHPSTPARRVSSARFAADDAVAVKDCK
jgi:hypothetical protein